MASVASKIFRITLLILNAVLFGATLGINFVGEICGLFDGRSNKTKYDLDIVPVGWTLGVVDAIVYINAAIFITYSIANIFRTTPSGNLYYSPDIITVSFLFPYMLNWVCNCGWILLDMAAQENSGYLIPMAVVLWLICVCLVIALVYSYRALDKQMKTLQKYGMTRDIWLIRVLLQNGSSFYATWMAIAGSINVGFVVAYVDQANKVSAGRLALSIVAVLAAIYIVLDIVALDQWTRYVLTPHCVLVLCLNGSLERIGVDGSPNSIFVLTLLMLSQVALLVKITLAVVRSIDWEESVSVKVVEDEDSTSDCRLLS